MVNDRKGEAAGAFARRLELLFRAKAERKGPDHLYKQVVDALAGDGVTVTATYLYMLRTGRRTNPRIELVAALARYFDVPVGYLLADDDSDDVESQLRLLLAMRDSAASSLMLRAHGLSTQSRSALALIIERFREADGLDSGTYAPGEEPAERDD